MAFGRAFVFGRTRGSYFRRSEKIRREIFAIYERTAWRRVYLALFGNGERRAIGACGRGLAFDVFDAARNHFALICSVKSLIKENYGKEGVGVQAPAPVFSIFHFYYLFFFSFPSLPQAFHASSLVSGSHIKPSSDEEGGFLRKQKDERRDKCLSSQ